MVTFTRLSIATLIVAVFCRAASAATYYVDNSASARCSNHRSFGSERKPWCTIGYGISAIDAGDTLIVKQGTYDEAPLISGREGSAKKPIVIRARAGDVVTIRGAGNTGRVKIAESSYLTFDGFVVTNFNQGIFVE